MEEVKQQVDGHIFSKYLVFYSLLEAKECMIRHFIKFPGWEEFKEEMENRERNSVKRYFVVTKGKKPGIYGSVGEAERQTKDFPDGKYVEFKDFHEAEKYWKNARKEMISDIWDSIGTNVSSSGNTTSPVALEKPSPSKKKARAFVVTKGRMPGVFFSEEEAIKQVDGYPGGKYLPFPYKKDAMDYWQQHGTTPHKKRRTPDIDDDINNGIMDSVKELISKKKSVNDCGNSLASENEFSEDKPYYAVLRGRKTGVFMSWDKAKVYVEGFDGAICWGFDTYQDAEKFMGGRFTKEALKAEAIWATKNRNMPHISDTGAMVRKHDSVKNLKKIHYQKYYAVIRGHQIGVFDSFSEAKKQVDGYQGGYFKAFPTAEKAREYFEKQWHKQNCHIGGYRLNHRVRRVGQAK